MTQCNQLTTDGGSLLLCRRIARLDFGSDCSGVFKTSGIRNESSIGSRRCWYKDLTAWLWVRLVSEEVAADRSQALAGKAALSLP